MFRKLVVIGILFSGGLANGQPIYFDELYGDNLFGQGLGKNSTIVYEGGYLSWGTSFGNMKPYLLIVDDNGSLVNDVYPDLPDSVSYQCSQLERLTDSTFIGKCFRKKTWLPSSEQGDYCLIRFDVEGEVLSEWVYGYPDRIDAPQHFMQTIDGGFLISGQTQFEAPPDTDGQLYAVKIDSEGSIEWEGAYGGSLYESGGSAIQTADGGFFLLGWTRSFGAGQKDWYLVKTDAQGNEQWSETYGDSNNQSASSIVEGPNGSYILVGGGGQQNARIIRIDVSGNVIWQKTYAHPEGSGSNYLFDCLVKPDSTIVAVGGSNNLAEGDAGWLLKTDSEGTLLWQRKYNKNSQTDLFYSVLATDDGGFLLSGQAVNEETNSQDAWLLKVDSVGCPYPNCIVGIDEKEKMVLVDVWPNPCTDVLNVELLDPSAALRVAVMDINGKEICKDGDCFGRSSLAMTGRASIDVSSWPSGIYILNGTDDKGRSFSVKVVKQ